MHRIQYIELAMPRPHHETPWLDLKEAADYLGIHFTTLRRWADQGRVPSIRTPGGRRRFNRAELAVFLAALHSGAKPLASSALNLSESQPNLVIKHPGVLDEPWYQRLDDQQRSAMRQDGQHLMAILMQYATHGNGGDAFLQEGKRLATQYGQACYRAELSMVETVHAFLLIRRSIKDSVYDAGALAGSPDADTWRLSDRMNDFLDEMLLNVVAAYDAIARHEEKD
jgi:excisionase family DNA binding protein